MAVLSKRIIISLPVKLYNNLKRIAAQEYKSVAGIVRESIMERMEDEFTKEELALIEQGHREFKSGKGWSWRSLKHG